MKTSPLYLYPLFPALNRPSFDDVSRPKVEKGLSHSSPPFLLPSLLLLSPSLGGLLRDLWLSRSLVKSCGCHEGFAYAAFHWSVGEERQTDAFSIKLQFVLYPLVNHNTVCSGSLLMIPKGSEGTMYIVHRPLSSCNCPTLCLSIIMLLPWMVKSFIHVRWKYCFNDGNNYKQ